MKMIQLSEQCELITKGTTPTTLGHSFTDSGVPFIRVENIKAGEVQWNSNPLFISTETHDFLARSKIRGGDVLVSIAGTIGRAGVVPCDAPPLNCNQAVAIIRPTAGVNRYFLRHWLESKDAVTQITATAVTGTISNLSLTQLGNLKIPLPSIEEQKRIADILDATDALRAKRRRALARLDDLARSLFLHHFGDPVSNPKAWPVVTLENLLSEIESGKSPVCLDRPATETEWGVLKLGAVTWGDFDAEENKALPPDATADTRYEVKPGDLLFSRKNTYEHVAAVSLVRTTRAKLLLPDLIFRLCIKSDANLISDYLFGVMAHPEKRASIQQLAGGAAASMPNISKAKLLTVPIPVPPIALQRRFAAEIAAVESLKAKHRAGLARLDTLFASLQDRAFSGKL